MWKWNLGGKSFLVASSDFVEQEIMKKTLDIVAENPDKFRVVAIAAGSIVALLAKQVKAFKPQLVSIRNESLVGELKEALADADYMPEIIPGEQGVIEVTQHPDCVTVVTGILGCAGLKENVDALIECVMKDTGFSQGKPVATFTIYKCLLHWKSFESERTNVFGQLIEMIGSAIENQDNNEHMAYWLSNTSALVFLIQKSLRPEGSSSARKPPPPTSLFGRMTMGFRSSSVTQAAAAAALEVVVCQVEAKYPTLLFKQQLTTYVEKIYGIIRDYLKKELGSLLALCIQAPQTSKGLLRFGRSFGKDSQSSH